MQPQRAIRFLLTLAGCALLSACATPSPVAGSFRAVTPRQAQHSSAYDHLKVRWGGVLIGTEPKTHRTCFTVMALPLNHQGWPQSENGQANEGRFIACASGFYDPQQYRAGRKITFIGTITGHDTRKIGGYDYVYPVLHATTVHLWPKRSKAPQVIYMNGFWGPYMPCGPWPAWGC